MAQEKIKEIESACSLCSQNAGRGESKGMPCWRTAADSDGIDREESALLVGSKVQLLPLAPLTKPAKVLLLAVPNYNPVYAHPAIPYLTGYLKKKGIPVKQKDLNALAYDFLLSKEFIRELAEKRGLRADFPEKAEEARDAMKSLDCYNNFEAFVEYKKTISESFDLISEFSEETISVDGNSFPYRIKEFHENGEKVPYKSKKGLLLAIKNRKENFFYRFFEEIALPIIEKEKADLIGISICDEKQLVTGFVLSSMIKEKFPKTKIVMGGTIITRNIDKLTEDNEITRKLFNYVDFFIHHEGEEPLAMLAEKIGRGKNYKGIPKLIYTENKKVKENLEYHITDLSEVPAPDYDGFTEKLWTPRPVIAYLTQRGCPHACNFCDIPIGYDHSYKMMAERTGKKFIVSNPEVPRIRGISAERAVREIKEMKEKYDSNIFSFSNEELLSHFLDEFCDQIEKEKLEIEWECYARMEKRFADKEFAKKIYKGGCRFMQFGIESASQKVLELENKMTEMSDYSEILESTAKAGILNHGFILVGTPFDSVLESLKLLAFLEDNKQNIHTIKPITYKISKWSKNAENPEKIGVEIDSCTPDLSVNMGINSKPKFGMSKHKAKSLVELIELWVKKRHHFNPVVREYIYTQRLFLGHKKITELAKEQKNKPLTEEENKFLEKFTEMLKEEITTEAYRPKADFVSEWIEIREAKNGKITREEKEELKKKYSVLYNKEKEKRKFLDAVFRNLKKTRKTLSLNELIEFSRKLLEFDLE